MCSSSRVGVSGTTKQRTSTHRLPRHSRTSSLRRFPSRAHESSLLNRFALPLGMLFLLALVGCGGSGGMGAPANSEPVTFDFEDAVGLARQSPNGLSTASGTAASGVVKVTSVGSLAEILKTGMADIDWFFIANDTVYMAFTAPVVLEDESSCVLAEVGTDGVPTCVDAALDWVYGPTSGADQGATPIQVDQNGAIYYRGSAGGRNVIRRNADGVITDLYTAQSNIEVFNYAVALNGDVYMTGSTNTEFGSERWIRRINPDNSVEQLQFEGELLGFFPDGNLYFDTGGQINRFLMATKTYDEADWITPYLDEYNGYTRKPHYVLDIGDLGKVFRTPNQVFTIPTYRTAGNLFQIFPSPQAVPTSVATLRAAEGILTSFILAGKDDNGDFAAVLVDANTGQETDLLGDRNIEVFAVQYRHEEQKIYLNGLDFDTNTHVLAQYDLQSGLLTSAPMMEQLVDFQVFGSDVVMAQPRQPAAGTEAPIAEIMVNPGGYWEPNLSPLTGVFSGAGSTDRDGTIVSYLWLFEGTHAAEGMVVSHEFSSEGTHEVSLTVVDDTGMQTTKSIDYNQASSSYGPKKSLASAVSSGNYSCQPPAAYRTTSPRLMFSAALLSAAATSVGNCRQAISMRSSTAATNLSSRTASLVLSSFSRALPSRSVRGQSA